MVSNSTVCHNFANNQKENQRSNNVYWISGWNNDNIRTIYSYGPHFAMCRIYEREKTALFTYRGYSNTTSKHLSDCISAINRDYYKIIRIYDPAGSLDENLKQYKNQIRENAEKALKARKEINKLYYLNECDAYFTYCYQYLQLIQREDKIQDIENYYNSIRSESGLKNLKLDIEKANREKREAEKMRRAESEKRVKDWENGENVSLMWDDMENNVPLRIEARKGYNVIMTGKGVAVLISEAQRIAKILLSGDPGEIFKLYVNNSYRLREANDICVKIGCHTFKTSYLKMWAEKVLTINA